MIFVFTHPPCVAIILPAAVLIGMCECECLMMISDVRACVWFQFGSVIALATKNNKPSRRRMDGTGHKIGLDLWPPPPSRKRLPPVTCMLNALFEGSRSWEGMERRQEERSVQWHVKMRSIETGLRLTDYGLWTTGYGLRDSVYGLLVMAYGLYG